MDLPRMRRAAHRIHYELDTTKPAGYKEQTVKKQNGSVWQSYIEHYLNGELVERKDLEQSTYRAFSAVYIVGPDATPEPDKTPKPTDSDNTPEPTPSHTHEPEDTPKPTPEPTPKPTPEPTDGGDD